MGLICTKLLENVYGKAESDAQVEGNGADGTANDGDGQGKQSGFAALLEAELELGAAVPPGRHLDQLVRDGLAPDGCEGQDQEAADQTACLEALRDGQHSRADSR